MAAADAENPIESDELIAEATPTADIAALPETFGKTADVTAPLPEGLGGSMDGKRVPMNKFDEIKMKLAPYAETYSHYLGKMQPWREFIIISKPQGDIKQRLEANLTTYQVNYAAVVLVQTLVAIVTNMRCLMVMFVMALGWAVFLKKNEDPNWQLQVGGMDLGKKQRSYILAAVSGIVLLSVVGQVLFTAAFFGAITVLAHGVLHPPPETNEAASDEKTEETANMI